MIGQRLYNKIGALNKDIKEMLAVVFEVAGEW